MAKERERDELTIEDAASYLGVTAKTLDRLVERGELNKYSRAYGKRRRFFLRSELEAVKLKVVKVEPRAPAQVVES